MKRIAASLLLSASALAAADLRAVVVDGRNNHDWRKTTVEIQSVLQSAGGFRVDVATAPPNADGLRAFHVDFFRYDVVILNYTDFGNGGTWAEPLRSALERYVGEGGGLVAIHAASSAFPEWKEFNRMLGIGGWAGRDEKSGPRLYYRDGSLVRETAAGRGGHHGPQHAFQVIARRPDHPILRGLPPVWMHARDELFDSLRGPADRLTVIATAWSDPAFAGTGNDEPVLITVEYGRGRVFHTTLGHNVEAMKGAGFRATLARGAEWAATGTVTLAVPPEAPTTQETKSRP